MRSEIENFTTGLKGADDRELATMLVVANILRINLTASGRFPDAALDFSIPRDRGIEIQCERLPIVLVYLIRDFQKRDLPSDAFGVMVWLHSVRALNVPELRILGREMWKELSYGFPYVDEALEIVQATSRNPMPLGIENELTFIPIGLEPRSERSR